MSGPASVSTPYVQHLLHLLKELSEGHIQIPRFQRSFVWGDEKRLNLLRSIRDGIPIGSILLWRTNLTTLGSATQLGPHQLPQPRHAHATERNYLLDGMQRLATLYGCLWPLPKGQSPLILDEGGELQSWLVCYDLLEEDFKLVKTEPPPATWLPLALLLDSIRLLQFQRRFADRADADTLIRRSDMLAERFRTYMLPIIPINTDDLADATRTFQLINSEGSRMSELHMVRALTWSEGFDLEEAMERVTSSLEREGWESIEPEIILQACKAALGIDISVEAPDKLAEGLKGRPETLEQVTQGLAYLARWLQWVDIRSPRLVPYSAQIVMLAEAFRSAGSKELPESSHRRLRRWLWQTTYSGYFASISGYRVNTLLESLRTVAQGGSMTWPSGKEPVPGFGIPQRFDARAVRIKAAALQLARLKPLDEQGRDVGALDLLAGQGPKVMVHIVPPSSSLAGSSSIANRTFAAPGSELVHRLHTDPGSLRPEILSSHLIEPAAAEALKSKDYKRFLKLRMAALEAQERRFFESLPEG